MDVEILANFCVREVRESSREYKENLVGSLLLLLLLLLGLRLLLNLRL